MDHPWPTPPAWPAVVRAVGSSIPGFIGRPWFAFAGDPAWKVVALVAAAEIQRRMALRLQECCRRGWLGEIQLGLLDNGLTELANAQGGCERIRNTPMPRHYNYFIKTLIHVDCVLLPLGLVASLGLLTPVGSALLGFGFLALESIGRDLEHPFDNSAHDVAMTSLRRTIEIDPRQFLGEVDLPAPIEPVRGVLWERRRAPSRQVPAREEIRRGVVPSSSFDRRRSPPAGRMAAPPPGDARPDRRPAA